jgi:hypothetical protein
MRILTPPRKTSATAPDWIVPHPVSPLRPSLPGRPRTDGAREASPALPQPSQNERNTVKMLKISALAIAAALSLGACGRDGLTDPTGLRIGQFDGQIAGTLDGRLVGDAASGSTVSGFHDIIVLTDYAAGIEITIVHETDEFFMGRYPVGNAVTGYLPIVAYVHLLDTDEWFDSLHGEIDIFGTHTNGFEGTASFSAESDEVIGDIVNVDVSFVTDYAGRIDYSLSPSFSRTPKTAAGGS